MSKITSTRSAGRIALGVYLDENGAAFTLFNDGWSRPAQRAELKILTDIPAGLAAAYITAAKDQAVKEAEREREAQRRARLRFFRVRWTEEYEQVREAESAEQAEEERDDEDAFIGCTETSVQEVARHIKPSGIECSGCDKCEAGWLPVIDKEAA